MKQRDYSLDLMKAFAIFLVVMDHLIRKSDSDNNVFLVFIYSCHMPLFFFVSGMLAYRKMELLKDVGLFFAKKCRLLIPIIVFGLGNVIILNQSIDEFFIWHKFGLWFLWTLFLFFAIYALSQAVLIKNRNNTIELTGLIIPVLVIYSSACYYLLVYSIIALFIIISCILISEVLKMNKILRLLAFGVK